MKRKQTSLTDAIWGIRPTKRRKTRRSKPKRRTKARPIRRKPEVMSLHYADGSTLKITPSKTTMKEFLAGKTVKPKISISNVAKDIRTNIPKIRPAQTFRVRIPKLRKKIWRSSIGHYGGMHVAVPKEHWGEFKSLFPKRMLPREVRTKNIAENYSDRAEKLFHKLFPKSHGEFKELYFAHGTKGSHRFSMELFPLGVSPVIDHYDLLKQPPLAKPNMKKVLRGWG